MINTNNITKKAIKVLGLSQIHVLCIKQFLYPSTKYVTGFIFNNAFNHGISFIVFMFQIIPDSQNTAVTNYFTKFEKSLLIQASNDENKENTVKNRKFSNM